MLLRNTDISKRTVTALEKRHIYTEDDLRRWTPLHYRDFTSIKPLDECRDGEICAVEGRLTSVRQKVSSRKYLTITVSCRTADQEERKLNVMIFSRVFLQNTFRSMTGKKIVVCR